MGRLYVDELVPNSGTLKLTQNGATLFLQSSVVGDLHMFRTRAVTSQAFPYWNLSLPDQTVLASLYPDYVTYLRNIKVETPTVTLMNGTVSTSGNTTAITFTLTQTLTPGTLLYFHSLNQFRVVTSNNVNALNHTVDEPITAPSLTSCSVINLSSYTTTFSGSWTSSTQFTLDSTSALTNILVSALGEDLLYGANYGSNNSYSNWMVLRSNLVESNIVGISSNVITISGATYTTGASTIELYPHRILASLNALHKQVDDSVLINNGMQVISGLRIRDRMQGHTHTTSLTQPNGSIAGIGSSGNLGNAVSGNYGSSSPVIDSVNGNPRIGQFTRPRGLGVYFYEYMGNVAV